MTVTKYYLLSIPVIGVSCLLFWLLPHVGKALKSVDRSNDSEEDRWLRITKTTLFILRSSVNLYKSYEGVYPSNEQGLAVVATHPDLASGDDPDKHLKLLTIDLWGTPYGYTLDAPKSS